MCEEPVADGRRLSAVESSIRQISRDCAYLRTIFRPFPLEDVSGCRVLYATTAPESAGSRLREHLEEHFGATVVATSHRLADRAGLRADLSKARGSYEVLLTELKAAAVDVGVRQVLAEGVRVVFCDNQLVALDGKQALEQALGRIATLARQRAGNS
jgi:cyclic 2,3-diphosphoglycerate synthetase